MASGNQGNKGAGSMSNCGFASMVPQQQREIARKGGNKAAHEKGTAHEFTSEEAREAGRKGRDRPAAAAINASAEYRAN